MNINKINPYWSEENKEISNVEILMIMNQIKNKSFKYLGDFDYDLHLVKEERDKLKFNKSYDKYAITLSLWGSKKKYTKHWVGVYIDVSDKISFELMDSEGDSKVYYLICPAINYIKRKMLKYYPNKICVYKWTRHIIQNDYDSCGLFVIDFFINRLSNKSFKDYVEYYINMKSRLNPILYYDEIQKLRSKYFIIK